MKKAHLSLLLIPLLLLSLAGCGTSNSSKEEEKKITVENVGIAIESLDKKSSTNTVDTKSKAFKGFLEDIRDYASNSSKLGESNEYFKVTSNESGIVIEIADERYNKFVLAAASANEQSHYTDWKTYRDSLANLSKSISTAGYQKYNKACDGTIYMLNIHDKDKVLLYVFNGEVVFDIMDHLGEDYAEAPSGYANHGSSSHNSGNQNSNNSPSSTSNASSGQRNALFKAQQYLEFSAFSYKGLIDQLEFEGYSHSDAQYAADNCGADWYEQSLLKAKQYLDASAFSYTGLKEQLEYEGFTSSEAKYGVDNCGADWYEQAYKKAKEYLEFSSFSESGLIDQLEYEGFTSSQAKYGVEKAY